MLPWASRLSSAASVPPQLLGAMVASANDDCPMGPRALEYSRAPPLGLGAELVAGDERGFCCVRGRYRVGAYGVQSLRAAGGGVAVGATAFALGTSQLRGQ